MNTSMAFEKITEQPSRFHNLEKMSIGEILVNTNSEDKTVPAAIEKAIPQIEKAGRSCYRQNADGRSPFLYWCWN